MIPLRRVEDADTLRNITARVKPFAVQRAFDLAIWNIVVLFGNLNTRSMVAGLMLSALLLIILETVETDTPASCATSLIVIKNHPVT